MENNACEELFVSPLEMRDWSHQLAHLVWQSGFRPTHLVALWRGGAQVALYIDEYLTLLGCAVDNTAVRTSLYQADKQAPETREVRVHGEQYLVDVLQAHHRLLVVDDILESGRSVGAFLATLGGKLGDRMPTEVRLATLLTKSAKHVEGNPQADYRVRDVVAQCWVNFPHELVGLNSLQQLQRQMSPDGLRQLIRDLALPRHEDLSADALTTLPPLHRALVKWDWSRRRRKQDAIALFNVVTATPLVYELREEAGLLTPQDK